MIEYGIGFIISGVVLRIVPEQSPTGIGIIVGYKLSMDTLCQNVQAALTIVGNSSAPFLQRISLGSPDKSIIYDLQFGSA